MLRTLALGALFSLLWLALSGLFEPLLLGLGAFSVTLVLWVERRIERASGEALPHGVRLVRLPAYLCWLSVEIVKSNIEVTKHILARDLRISPTLLQVPCSQHTDLARVVFANSITLTPGTVSMRVEEGQIEVHALTAEAAADLEAGEMDRRVSRLEGRD